MIIQQVNFSQFKDAFIKAGRGDQFSDWGLKVIYSYLDNLETDYELDVIAICCDYVECEAEDVFSDYYHLLGDVEGIEELVEELETQTLVVGYENNRIVFVDF